MSGPTQSRAMPVEFLRLPSVQAATGLSRSEIYRRVREGRFPKPRGYADAPSRKFWTSIEVERWQRDQVGDDDFEALLR